MEVYAGVCPNLFKSQNESEKFSFNILDPIEGKKKRKEWYGLI